MSSCRQVLASRLHLRAVPHCAHIHIHTHIHNHTRTHTHCACAYPPNATRRPSVLMMVCAARLGTCNMRSRKERPSPHFLVSGIFAHDHTPQAYTHTHTSIHTYNRNTHTHIHKQIYLTHTHTPANYTHEHISLRHNSHHTYVHDHTHIIHTYTNTYMHPHTRIPPTQSPVRFLLSFHSCTLTFLSLSFGRS